MAKKRKASPTTVADGGGEPRKQPKRRQTDLNSAMDTDPGVIAWAKDLSAIVNLPIPETLDILSQCTKELETEESFTEIVEIQKMVIASFLAKFTAFEKENNTLKELIVKQSQYKESYASMTAKSSATAFHSLPKPITRMTTKDPEDVIVIKPNKTDEIHGIESKLKTMIRTPNPNGSHNIYSMRNTKNVILIKKPKSDISTRALIGEINSNTDINTRCNAYSPRPLQPTIVIKGIKKDNDLSKLTQLITSKNDHLKDHEKDIFPLFKMENPRYPDTVDYAVQVSTGAYEEMKRIAAQEGPKTRTYDGNDDEGIRIFIGTQCCSAQTRVFVKQCQKCLSFKHTSRDCQGEPICKSCGKERNEGHTCNKESKCCVNCSRSEKYKTNTNHSPNTNKCPIYYAQEKRLESMICYGTQHNTNSLI